MTGGGEAQPLPEHSSTAPIVGSLEVARKPCSHVRAVYKANVLSRKHRGDKGRGETEGVYLPSSLHMKKEWVLFALCARAPRAPCMRGSIFVEPLLRRRIFFSPQRREGERGNNKNASALSAGAYTTTWLVLVI